MSAPEWGRTGGSSAQLRPAQEAGETPAPNHRPRARYQLRNANDTSNRAPVRALGRRFRTGASMLTNEPWSETNRVWLAQGTYASPFRRTTRYSTSPRTAAARRIPHRHRDAAHSPLPQQRDNRTAGHAAPGRHTCCARTVTPGAGPSGSERSLDGDSVLLAPADRAGTRENTSRLDPHLRSISQLRPPSASVAHAPTQQRPPC